MIKSKIIKKSVILFWLLNMTFWCRHVHRLELQKFLIFVLRTHQLYIRLDIETEFPYFYFWHGCQKLEIRNFVLISSLTGDCAATVIIGLPLVWWLNENHKWKPKPNPNPNESHFFDIIVVFLIQCIRFTKIIPNNRYLSCVGTCIQFTGNLSDAGIYLR